jgi:hypothetical protein
VSSFRGTIRPPSYDMPPGAAPSPTFYLLPLPVHSGGPRSPSKAFRIGIGSLTCFFAPRVSERV